ncbi:MAG TPA: MaoC/PaaZ C-terminal domain-containing protein, partial [Nevskiaceae bacterium]|nr:MaoC/PaaZ C-terminal domain-containing protein [Nevskiaceae bacterium]
MTEVLSAMPSALALYAKAAATARRKPKGKPQIPALDARMDNVRADAAKLAAYNKVCGFEPGEQLPITYPQVMIAALHMHLMSNAAFPLPMLGLVHVRNHIEQTRALRADESFTVNVRTGESRDVRQGLEFDIHTEFSAGEETPWRSVMTILYRMKGPKGQAKAPPVPAPALAEYRNFDAPADIGRRYAKVSGDHNPIHTSAVGAKLFGFPRAIAHGMWTLARVTALVG